jgi:tetratricopeptide (TPR) repeat protein
LAEAYSNRGSVYADLKQPEKAIEDCGKALALNPNNAEAYRNRGNTYASLNQYEKAIEDYGKALALNPNHEGIYSNRGNAYAELKEYERAIEDYNKAIGLNSNLAEAYNNRGNAYAGLNQHEQAIEDYNKAIELNPNLAEAYHNRGTAYAEKQHWRAIEDYDKAIELNPNYAEAYGMRGIAYTEIEKYEEAARDLKRAGFLFFYSGTEKDAVRAFSFCFELRAKIESEDVIYCGLALFLITRDANIDNTLRKMQIQDETMRKIFELAHMKLRGDDISDEIAMLEEREKRKEIKILLELLKYI